MLIIKTNGQHPCEGGSSFCRCGPITRRCFRKK